MTQDCEDKTALSDTQAGRFRPFTDVSKFICFHVFPWKLSAFFFSIAPLGHQLHTPGVRKGFKNLSQSLLFKPAVLKMAARMEAQTLSQSAQYLPCVCWSTLAGNNDRINAFISCKGGFRGSKSFCFMVKSKTACLLSCDHVPYCVLFPKYSWTEKENTSTEILRSSHSRRVAYNAPKSLRNGSKITFKSNACLDPRNLFEPAPESFVT